MPRRLRLSHLDATGRAHMVDIGDKPVTTRLAVAAATVRMQPATLRAITAGTLPKGDVFAVARLAGIAAAKRTADLIPLCHPLALSHVEVALTPRRTPSRVDIEASVRLEGRTGAEMEALTAASVAALAIYDMCKAVDRDIEITAVRLLRKEGGEERAVRARDDALPGVSGMRVVLKPGRDFSVRSGHPWIFSGAIASVEGDGRAGDVAAVHAADGRLLGSGMWNPATSIAVRMLTSGARPVDAAFVAERIREAVELRSLVSDTDALRLVNGEGDRFPGLVVDRYGDFAVCQFLTAGADALKALVVDALGSTLALRGLFERSEGNVRTAEGLTRVTRVLAGEEPPPEVVITESGRRHVVDVRGGQKTGFFLDQRPNRDLVGRLAAERRVLNLFAYSGGFSIAAAQGGAVHVTSVDSSAAALALAESAWRLNDLAPARATFVRADVFEYLRTDREPADLVVLDPPPFARRRADRERARAGYKDVNLRVFRGAAPGALVLTFSCSQHVDAGEWEGAVAAAAGDAGRSCRVLARLGPGVDHPQALAHSEGRYLKGLLLRVE